jgi:acetyl esterase
MNGKTASLHPQCAALLRALEAQGQLSVECVSPEEARKTYGSRGDFKPTPIEVASIGDVLVPIGARHLALRLYRPFGISTDVRLPALIYFHGGGWLMGNIETHDALCRELCNASQTCLVSVEYRLAPEHPYPAALEDARSALAWVFDNSESAFIDTQRIAVGGDSAGANLAAVMAIETRESPGRRIAFQMLVYPPLDLRCSSDSYERNGRGFGLTRDLMEYFVRQYAAGADVSHWQLSPGLCDSLDGVAPALMIVAGFDPLHAEGLAYAQRLSAAGVRVTFVDFARQIHGFFTMGRVVDEANDAVLFCATALRRALHGTAVEWQPVHALQ